MIGTISQFLLKYPDFSQPNKQKLYFIGNIKVEDDFYNIRLHLSCFPLMKNFEYKLFQGLYERKLKPFDANINIDNFLQNFSEHLELGDTITLKNDSNNIIKNKIEVLSQICELKTIKNCNIFTNQLNSKIKFDNFDNYYGHYLELQINKTSEVTVEVLQHSLPEIKTSETTSVAPLFNSSSTILQYYEQFIKLLQNLELFYKYLNVIDELCFVCSPNKPTTKDNWRLFKLDDNKCFIKVILNPISPDSPEVNFYGPTSAVESYREMYNKYASKWDLQIDLYKNLLKAFDIMYFPMKRNDQMEIDEESDAACNICLSYYLDGQVPICSCDNLKCGLFFHVFCLKQWFTTSTDRKKIFNVTIGFCPVCKSKLSTSFQTLLN